MATQHAKNAMTAAEDAAKAAEQARLVEVDARQADAERLAAMTAEAVMAAEVERTEEAERLAQAAWDEAQEKQRDEETRALLASATAPPVPLPEVVLANGRRVAARLMQTGGTWTRIAAEEALIGSELDVRAFVTTGLNLAAAQDDRAVVAHLADSTDKPALKTAAETALTRSDADVREFLRTRSYPGKTEDDRILIGQLITAGGPTTKTAAQAALNGTDQDRHEFPQGWPLHGG